MKKSLVVSASLLFLLVTPSLSPQAESKTDRTTSLPGIDQSTVAYSSETYYYKDLRKDHWAADSIKQLVDKGYMNAFEDGTFKPNSKITRGEAARVIARAMQIPLDSAFGLKAADVPQTHPYYAEIRKLAELGIVENDERFNPSEPLKRSHICKMIALAFDIVVDKKNDSIFKDYTKDYWAKNYIESLADAEIVKGKTQSTFSPNEYVTRAHLAGLTVRGMELRNKVENLEVAYDFLAKDYISTYNNAKQWTKEVIALVNEERKERGLESLQQDLELNQLAIIKAQDMIKRDYFDHESPYYGHPWDMATLFDYEYTSFGENIARNFKTPKEVVDAWMASEKHRDNILKSSYTNIGIGVKSDTNGKFYWVQLFSSK